MNNRFHLYLLVLVTLLIVFMSCGNNTQEPVQDIVAPDTSIKYGDTSYGVPSLTEQARQETLKWSVFEDFENELQNINGANLETLLSSSDRLLKYTDSLIKTIPAALMDQAIVSRMLVTKTRAGLVHQELRLSKLDSAAIQERITDLNTATENLFTRINEKFRKQDIDEERRDNEAKELEQQQKFIDSVYQAELRDNES